MTIPNLISMVRLIGAPILLWLASNGHDLAVIFVLIVASASDYLDGKLARMLKQQSKLGEILDPTTDRIYIAAILYLLWSRDIFPNWLVISLVARDVILLLINAILKAKRLPLTQVTFMGKAATFNLLYALPLLFVSSTDISIAEVAWIFGWGFATWGIVLYFLTGFRYLNQSIRSIRFPSNLIVN
jgi:cardiolipin synthase